MRRAGKVWGVTQLVESNPTLELHQFAAAAGHRCSRHLHQTKYNGFFVLEGLLLVRVWQADSGTVDETYLKAGDWMVVRPGLYHQFEAVDDTVCLELYWSQMSHDDIVRDTFGE